MEENMLKAMDLFTAYKQDQLPKEEGYIVSSFFSYDSPYTIYEVISYSGVKAIYATQEGLTFQSNGKKLYVLLEPASFPQKSMEPYCREKDKQIPMRFKELNIHTAKNQTKIMSSIQPVDSLSSFTILQPTGINFSFIFYMQPDVIDSLELFFNKTFTKEAGIPGSDAKIAAKTIVDTIKNTMIWEKDKEIIG